ncbi:MAG: PSD1 and planctomycete cytochrome C domain-containing protein, partial [Planctomycetaceae bacterium]
MAAVVSLECAADLHAAEPAPKFTAAQIEFFETRIRPLLVSKCYRCHSGKAKKLKAGLRLDDRSHLLKGGESGPACVPGQPEKSLLIHAVRYESVEMPPDGKLKPSEIADLTRWIAQGAAWPVGRKVATPTPAETQQDWGHIREGHWAWRPVRSPDVPRVAGDWARTDIDRFVWARLTAAGLRPSRPADSVILVRRMYADLIGLPPTPSEIRSFVERASQDRGAAVEALLTRLLDSPHYGERWGRYWLDVARYSDGHGGFLDRAALPQAWRYRDWVVAALNRDLPYDEFVRLQIAGDLIGKDDQDAMATGFFALGPTYNSDGGDPDSVAQAKSETLDDRLDTLGRGFMGLTVACARCHDHKFDPIPQLDYYSLAGVFNNSRVVNHPLADAVAVKAYDDHQRGNKELNTQIANLTKQAKQQKRELTSEEQKRIADWKQELVQRNKNTPAKYETCHALADSGTADMKLALRGNLRKPGPVAPRRFLRLLAGADSPKFLNGSGRVELAAAIASPDNPLTARVLVNRAWLHHFGRGLVRSPSNFGTLGDPPTHPLLLDWLAHEFVNAGWSLKTMHRLIMTSAVYQMSSRFDQHAFAIDGDNRLLWRMNPRRLDVEAWRDSLLAVTGELDRTLGGPPIDNIAAARRRTLYAKVSRNGDQFASDVFLRLFDFPIMRATVAQRPTSIVPQQFLFLMNSSFMIDRSRALLRRVEMNSQSDESRIEELYVLLFGRSCTQEELRAGLEFLHPDSSAVDPKTTAGNRPASKKLPVGKTPDRKPQVDMLVADFEADNYGSWKREGDAFGPGPARGTLPRQMSVTGFLGGGLVNTYFNGDGTTGRLTSPPIRVERKYLRFLIGGGGYPGKTCMNLLIDGQQVRTAVGPNTRGGGSEKLAWKQWD